MLKHQPRPPTTKRKKQPSFESSWIPFSTHQREHLNRRWHWRDLWFRLRGFNTVLQILHENFFRKKNRNASKLSLPCTKIVVSIHFPGSPLGWTSRRRELRQWTFVDTARSDALMNGSLIWEMRFVAPSCSLWLTRRGGTKRWGLVGRKEKKKKPKRAEKPDKAAPLSDQQGVFELSPEEGRRKEFWEGRAESKQYLLEKQQQQQTTPPHQGALLKCKACAASVPDGETPTD